MPRPGGTDYFRIPETGGEPMRITQRGAVMAEVSWDGRSLLYGPEGQGPLFLMNLDGSDRQVDECGSARNLASSASAFYYVGCADGPEKPLCRLDPVSGKRERLGVITNVNLGMTASPDGKTILYARENAAGADLMLVEGFR